MEPLIVLLADGIMLPIVLLAGYALVFKVPKGQRFQVYARILLAGLTAYLVAKLFATIYPVSERPFELLGQDPGASYLNNPGFPSDHALFAMFLLLAVWFETKQKWITIALVILVAAVCFGRVVALVHTPLDVIGGIAIAAFGALWYLQRGTPQRVKATGRKRKKAVQ